MSEITVFALPISRQFQDKGPCLSLLHTREPSPGSHSHCIMHLQLELTHISGCIDFERDLWVDFHKDQANCLQQGSARTVSVFVNTTILLSSLAPQISEPHSRLGSGQSHVLSPRVRGTRTGGPGQG